MTTEGLLPEVKTPDEELQFHEKRVDAKNVTVEQDSSREPDKVTTDVGKSDGSNLNLQSQKRLHPSVREAPQILLQADDTKRSSKNNRSCVSVQAHVDDRNELNVSRTWRTSQRAQDDHDKQVNVDDERPYTLPGRQASRQSEDDPCVNFDNVKAGPDILPGLHKFRQANDDQVENMGVGCKEEPRVSPGRSEPWFLRHADNCFVLRQLYKGRETVDHHCSTTGANIHFIVFVHGLGGRSCDFYWAKRWMKLLITAPKHLLIWSEANGGDKTFDEIGLCGERLAQEVANYLNNIGATNFKLSFVGFSLGCVTIRAALTCPQMRPYIKNLNTFLSLHGPHLGVLYANNKFLRFQLSLLSKMKMKGSMKQLAFQDSPDIRTSYIYILSRAPGFEYFKHVLLMGSSQDRIVPVHSSNVQHCTESLADTTVTGKVYEEMIENLLGPLLKREDVTLKRFDVFHDIGSLKYLSPVILSLSHVSTLMSRNLFEKFMLISGADCFN
ncbi:protein FAM135B-like [Ixodes scapularis]|uniref:protein FAM135B-like n=1 Tax=Ixodes scapularis TaxID=6945 RepID=UPI001C38C122|nr:protein FAM135B-like [Ixodes scapularis]